MYYGTREKVTARREIRVIKRELLYGSHRDGEHASTDECEHDRLYIQRNYVIVRKTEVCAIDPRVEITGVPIGPVSATPIYRRCEYVMITRRGINDPNREAQI